MTSSRSASAAATHRTSPISRAAWIPPWKCRPGAEVPVEVAYRSRGLGDWTYAFAREGVSRVRDFELVMTTDFAAIDFPAGTMSPTAKTGTATAGASRGGSAAWSPGSGSAWICPIA